MAIYALLPPVVRLTRLIDGMLYRLLVTDIDTHVIIRQQNVKILMKAFMKTISGQKGRCSLKLTIFGGRRSMLCTFIAVSRFGG